MNQAAVKEKIFNIESDLELLKRSILKEPDFDIDQRNWQNMKFKVKKIRKELYRRLYEEK